jgi:membrane-bound metal-dependent hydrolase YbcI (DUF457 family)
MGIGHLAASFAVRGRCPRVPLFLLLFAGAFIDVLWGIAILTGLERAHVGPETGSAIPIVLEDVRYTHSLIACLAWSTLASAAWWWWRRDRWGALVIGALVASHWLLDFVSHVPEMPLSASGPYVGLGLWRSRGWSFAVEIGMLWIGLALYARSTSAMDRIGSIGLVALSAVLTSLVVGAFFAPSPPSIAPIAMTSVALPLVLLLLGWVDLHRRVDRRNARDVRDASSRSTDRSTTRAAEKQRERVTQDPAT